MSTPVTGGDTDVTRYFMLRLAATGAAATGLTIANLDMQYVRNGVAPAAKVDATELAATDSAHADYNMKEIDATDQPGLYRSDWPDAAFAAGVPDAMLTINGATIFTETMTVPIDPPANVTKIDDDETAAANSKLQWNGTGLTGDTFPATQQQLGSIALTGSAVSTPAKDAPNGFVIAFGENEANDEDSTHALDGTTHDLEAQNDTGTEKIDAYYEFSIGGDGVPTGVQANVQFDKGGGAAKNLTVQALRWPGTWDTVGTLQSGTSLSVESFTLFTSHVGTGANLGTVRIRFLTGSVALSATSKLLVDQIFVEYAIVRRSVGYANGRIHVNTNASNTNTEAYVDGTADNPVSTWAAALTLSASVGLDAFDIATGSSITLTANSNGYALFGEDWDLGLGGQSIEGLHAHGANITGTGTATVTRPTFDDCHFAAVTVPPAVISACGIGEASGTFTAGSAGEYVFHECYSMVPGSGAPAFAFSGLGAATGINNRAWAGSATWTLDSNCTLSHEVLAGGGTTVTTGGANVEIRGITRSVDLVLSGAGTAQFVGVTGPITISGTATTTVNLYGVSASLADTSSGTTVTDKTARGPDVTDILADTAEIVTLLYSGPYGPGVYLDDAAANTDTVVGVDGRESNPVSTIAAATTIAGSLGIQRIYLVNDSAITLAQAYEGWDFRGLGLSNQINLGGQDVDNSCFCFMTVIGTQGGTGLIWTQDCGMTACVALQCIAYRAYLTGNNSLRASTMTMFDACKSAVAGNATPEITFTGAITNLLFRHFSGGLQVNAMAAEDTMSYESDGQIVVDATCTGGLIAVRGALDVTDNSGGAVTIVQTAAINSANIEAACTTSIEAAKLDHLVAAAESGDVVNDSIMAKLASKSATAAWADYINTTDSLQALRDRGDSAWITAVGFSTHAAADVWSVATRTLTSFGTLAADVWAVVTRTITGGNITQIRGTTLDTKVGSNLDLFFQNAGADTTKTVDDVGVAGSALTEQQVRDAMYLAPSAGAPADDSVDDKLDDIIAGGTLISGPIVAVKDPGNRIGEPVPIEMFQSAEKAFAFTPLDTNGDPVDMSGMTLRFMVYDSNSPPNSKFKVDEGANLVVSGDNNEIATVTVTSAQASTSTLRDEWPWTLRDTVTEQVVLHGTLTIKPSLADVP